MTIACDTKTREHARGGSTDYFHFSLSYSLSGCQLSHVKQSEDLLERRWWFMTIFVSGAWIAGIINGLLKWH
jgi:hypothetical protein